MSPRASGTSPMSASSGNGRSTSAGPVRRAADEEIIAALRRVHDPCSIAQNVPMSIYDLGLVRDWALDGDGRLEVRMCVTAPLCMLSRTFLEAAKEQLESLPGVISAHCYVDPAIVWTPQDMTTTGTAHLDARRTESQRLLPLRPQQRSRHLGDTGHLTP